ncbi:nicotinate-nucleotide--dimethylbenzimidazole phosphoribosyltransferase [Tessaracoccus defluvii]|uniref:nicotinate-nucleotide--dimethylbenzimidazole phosphoribosyltransferase n=1 Tax=Tessaracoccus defluvii TaxID=1285901 RepID=UPI0031E17BBA
MITPPDPHVLAAARAHVDSLAKPPGALGRLEDVAVWLAGCQGVAVPRVPARPRCIVLAGDHGVVADGVASFPSEITVAMILPILQGRAGVSTIAAASGTSVALYDISVAAPIPGAPEEVGRHKLALGCPSILTSDALTPAELDRALATGDAIAADEAAAGTDLLIVGDLGIGNTTPATALICAVLGRDPGDLTGRGAGLDDAGLARKIEVLRGALDRLGATDDPRRILAALGSPDLAVAVGLMLGAAARGIPILVDGVIAGAEALIASRIDPGVTAWLQAGHRSAEPASSAAIEALGLEPLLDLGMRLGEGSGAVAAVPLVQAAAAMASRMATLAELMG